MILQTRGEREEDIRRGCARSADEQMGAKMNCIAENEAMMSPIIQPLAP
jgi:hypothetical protein